MLARDAIPPDAAQREHQGAWESALVASGLPLAGLDLPKPRPRFALAAPLAATIAGEAELLDLWLVQRLPAWQVRETLATGTPPPFRLLEAFDVWLGEPALPGRVVASIYRAWFRAGSVDAAALRDAAVTMLRATTLPRERRKGDAVVAYDLRPSSTPRGVRRGRAGRRSGRPDDAPPRPGEGRRAPGRGVGRDRGWLRTALEPAGLVRERLVLGDPPPPRPKARQAVAASASRPRK